MPLPILSLASTVYANSVAASSNSDSPTLPKVWATAPVVRSSTTTVTPLVVCPAGLFARKASQREPFAKRKLPMPSIEVLAPVVRSRSSKVRLADDSGGEPRPVPGGAEGVGVGGGVGGGALPRPLRPVAVAGDPKYATQRESSENWAPKPLRIV